jgi:GNAT superfamily N-acetyltransferase
MDIRPVVAEDRGWLEEALRDFTAGPTIVSRGRLYDGLTLPGLVAVLDGQRSGVALYEVAGRHCEVLFLAALLAHAGAGAALLDGVVDVARSAGCERAWVITTNDNTPAIRFYQRCGWDLVAVHRNALESSRARKPSIPEHGHDGIPMRHELEFEFLLPISP